MKSTDTMVSLTLPSLDVGQILAGLAVLIEQWDATARYLRTGEIGDEIIRECHRPEEAESIARDYSTIAEEIERQLP